MGARLFRLNVSMPPDNASCFRPHRASFTETRDAIALSNDEQQDHTTTRTPDSSVIAVALNGASHFVRRDSRRTEVTSEQARAQARYAIAVLCAMSFAQR
jgi:hypothetical protein